MNGIFDLFAFLMFYLSIFYILFIISRECAHSKTLKKSLSIKSIVSEVECSICLEEGCNAELCCTHRFHKKCIHEWTKVSPTCPICRVSIDV